MLSEMICSPFSVESCSLQKIHIDGPSSNFGNTHLMKNYPDLLKIWNIDGADK